MRSGCLILLSAVLTTLCATRLAPAQEGPVNRAVVIGVNDYYYLRKLEYCVADAKLVRDQLVRGGVFKAGDVILMTDHAPEPQNRTTYANIERRLQTLSRAGGVETLLVFFAGHGVVGEDGRGYLVPIDGSRTMGLDLARVRAWLYACRAKHTLLILNCCRAEKGVKGLKGLAPGLAASAGVVVFASCEAQQQSLDDRESGHGVFSLYLAAGLSGKADGNKDGVVTVGEVFEYTRKGVSKWAFRKNLVQTPAWLPEKGAAAVRLARVPRGDTLEGKISEFKLPPDEKLPDVGPPDAAGAALGRVEKIKKLLRAKRAEIGKKIAWFVPASPQMKTLRKEEKALLEQLDAAAVAGVNAVKAELEEVNRAWEQRARKGLLSGHPEMRMLAQLRKDAMGKLNMFL